jgi:signal transduction histidine kinase
VAETHREIEKRGLSGPPEFEVGGALLWSALLAGVVACCVSLTNGLFSGWDRPRTISYAALALFFLLLTQPHKIPGRIGRWLCWNVPVYLAVMGLVGFALQSLSGDPFVQPIVFTIPLVHAALNYSARRTTLIGAGYLLLLGLGQWLNGQRGFESIVFPAASYGALMVFMYNFVRLSVAQAEARRHTNQLAADLAEQRDYLQRLAEATATLTRNLDLDAVLEYVTIEGRALARAGRAAVWLIEPGAGSPRLAASVPPRDGAQTWPTVREAPRTNVVQGGTLVLPLAARGETIGVLELGERAGRPFTEADAGLLQPFADAAGVAIENARLYQQARLSATLSERNRLARELHDTIAQGLTAVTMQLEAARRGFARDPQRARTRVARAHELARETLEDVRRSVWTLAAPLVDGQALNEALREQVDRFATRTGLRASYAHAGPAPQLGHAAATQLLRIAQEALTNVEKHARATEAHVYTTARDGEVRLTVEDNGAGFDPDELKGSSSPHSGGFGLLSLHERARLAGGTIEITSAPGKGTRVVASIPTTRT